MTNSQQWAALIVTAFSLLHRTSGGTVRRKRKHFIVHGDGGNGESRSASRDRYFYRRDHLFEMPRLLTGERELKSKRGGKRSRTGAYSYRESNSESQDRFEEATDAVESDTVESVFYHGAITSTAENLDWGEMTTEELQYFFQIEHAQSYPETGEPDGKPTSDGRPTKPNSGPTRPPAGATPPPTKKAATSPTPQAPAPATRPTPTPTPPPVKQPTRRPTRTPTPPPSKQPAIRPTPRPTKKTTPAPTNEATAETTPTDQNPQPLKPPTDAPTPSPPECEDMSRRDGMLMVIGEITDRSTLMNPGAPQAEAFAWMLNEDPAQVDPCSYPSTLQRYILVAHYFATSGESWENANGWLGQDGECIWLGINCNGSGEATRMELRENNLDGSLVPELSSLSSLRRLDVSGNTIRGQLVELPTSLVFLDVERNAMRGSPFQFVLALEDLRQLHLSSNAFTGGIPGQIGDLTSLEELWLANNQFGGATLPTEIGKLENLETLFLYNAQMGGRLPSELGRLDLNELLANNNRFESMIPEELWNNNGLTLLRLDSNEFSGSISTRVGNLGSLTDLFLNNNALSSTLPVQMQRLTSLVNLLLNDNALSGTIRDGFSSFRNLDFVDFSGNVFTGTLPSTLFDIRDLRFLYLSNNNLEGKLPENWGNAVLLRDLFLDNNQLTGTVPDIPQGAYTRLTELLLNGNMFTGEMPGSICQLRSSAILEDLWADCGGTPPEIQCALPSCCTFCFE